MEEMDMVANIEPLLTIADLDATPDDGNRYELIEGELFVSRAPSIAHQLIVQNFQMAIVSYLNHNPIGLLVPGAGVVFSNFSGVIPDLVFISQERRCEIASGDRLTGAPDLAIEIISPGAENQQRDRMVKRQLYSKYGVKEYWIADPEDRAIEIYRLRGKSLKLMATLRDNDELTSPLLPNFRLMVRDIFKM